PTKWKRQAAVVVRPPLAPSLLSRYWLTEVISDSTLPSKKWLAPGTIFCSMMMPFWVLSFSTRLVTSRCGTTASLSPWMISPDDGQGARKEKSYRLAGGAIEMKPSISGLRINSCMPIQAPNEKPAIQQLRASVLTDSAQSSAAAASDNSPMP